MKCHAMLLAGVMAAGSMACTASPAAADEPDRAAYDRFAAFCAATFGAQFEPLTYQHFGDTLSIEPSTRWMHASLHSAAIAWGTNLPTRAYVEFGPTPALGSKTTPADRYYATHLHHLTGLEPGTTYHYRLVSIDERSNTVRSPIETFTTALAEDDAARLVILDTPRIDAPIEITKPGYYLLTTDLVAAGTAFNIRSGNVTLDLGGHRVTYNQQKMEPIDSGDGNVWFERAPQGVRLAERNLKNIRVVNGSIRQGAGGDGAQVNGRGANPVGSMAGVEAQLAGLDIQWHGEQVTGMLLQWGPPIEAHHNVLTDLGTELTNRHQGVAAIQGAKLVHHNLITRTRQRGIDCVSGGQAYRNEVYIDSLATNSTGIATYKTQNLTIRDNRVFGGGYLAVGIGALSVGTADIRVLNNFVHLQATEPSDASSEYGDQSGAYCFRVTWGGQDVLAEGNTFITSGRDGGMVRGVWYCPDRDQKNNIIRNNTIKAVVENEKSDIRGAIVISGIPDPEGVEPVLIENNHIISNFCHVLLGEPYGGGHSARFVGNTFERVGELPRFRFVQIGHWTFPCTGSTFVDSKFVGPITHDQVLWAGEGPRSFDVAWTLSLRTAPDVQVTITDANGDVAAQGKSDDTGVFRAELIETRYADGKAHRHTPHQVTAHTTDQPQPRQITVDQAIELVW